MFVIVMFVEDGKHHAKVVTLRKLACQTSSATHSNLLDSLKAMQGGIYQKGHGVETCILAMIQL